VFLFTLEMLLWTVLAVVGAGLLLRVLSRNAFSNFLGWLMVAVFLCAVLVGPIWIAQTYGFEMLVATLGIGLLIVLGGGLWLVLWLRRSTECVG
jgi:hypothetical protein